MFRLRLGVINKPVSFQKKKDGERESERKYEEKERRKKEWFLNSFRIRVESDSFRRGRVRWRSRHSWARGMVEMASN